MKRLLLLALLLALSSSLMADPIYEENFESYEAGTELVGTVDGWAFFSTYDGTSTVVENEGGFTGKSLKLAQKDGGSADYDMIFTPKFSIKTDDPLRKLVRVSAKVVVGSGTDLFAPYSTSSDTNRFFYLNMNGSTGAMASYPSGVTFNNISKSGEINEISFLWDNYDRSVKEVTCNGETQSCNIPMAGEFLDNEAVRLRLSTQFSSKLEWPTYYDDIKVEVEDRYPAPHLYVDNNVLTLKKAAAGHITLQNAGPEGSITFSVSKSAGADWLTVSPSSGTYNGTKDLTFSTSGDQKYARAKVTIDAGDAGIEVVSVYWVNGTIFYKEDFEEPFMTQGDLQNQEGWLVRGAYCADSNKAEIEKPEFAESQVMHAYRATGYDGIRRGGAAPSPSIEGCPSMAIVKVSGKVYWASSSNAGSIYIATPYSAKPFCMKIKKTDGQNTFYLYQMRDGSYNPPAAFDGKTWPMDEWVYISYTIDLNSMKGVEVQIGEDVADISDFNLYNMDNRAFTGLSFCTDKASGDNDWDAKFYFDDIQCEYIPRGDEPILAVSTTSLHTGLTATNATFSVINAGGGSFNYTASLLGSASWLKVENPEGTCEDEVKLQLTIDREAMAEDYYRAVVSINGGEAGSTNVLITAGSGHIIYKEDFEEPYMQIGDLQGQDNWVVRGSNCRDSNEAYVADAHGTHCLYGKRAQGYDGIRNNYLSGCPENAIVKFSFKIYWDDQSEASSVYLATPAGMKPFCMKIRRKDDGTFYLYQMLDGSYQPPLDGYSWSMNEWIPISYTLDFRSQNGVTVQIGDDEADIRTLVLYGDGGLRKLEGFSFCTDGSGYEFDSMFYFDDFQMEIIDRPPDPVLTVNKDRVVVGFDATAAGVTFQNTGAGSFEWTATLPEDPSWLELTQASGTCTKEDEVRFNILRDEMESDYYRTTLHIDGGAAGEADVFICICSGSVFYKEDFEEPYMQVGDLQNQDGWVVRNGGYCRDVNGAYVTNGLPFTDNACMHTVVSKGMDGTTKDYVDTCPRDARVKISMDVYWDSASPCDAVYLACPLRHKPMTLKIENKGDGTFGVRGMQDDSYKVMVGKTWSQDEWVHISYTMDFRTQTGVELTIGDVTEDITQVVLYGNGGLHTYEGFSFCTDGDDDMDSLFYFDNLVFEVVPKDDKPHPVMPGAVPLSTDDSASVKVLNYGTPYDFSISMIDLADKVSVSPASGRTDDSTTLTFTVDRAGMEDSFYRARMRMAYSDGAYEGALTTLVTFAVGGWYYGADFLGPFFHYGPLNGQESWTAGAPECEIVNLAGENAIMYPFATTTELAAKIPQDGVFTFSGRVYSEELADDSYFHFGTVDGSGYKVMYISREGDPRELQFGYFQGNTWTPIATAPFGEWVDFSFTMDTDPNVASVTEITFGDFVTNFAVGDLPLEPKYDGKRIEKFTIGCHDVANPAGMYLSRIVIRDPSVPEPAIIALLALLGLAFARKQK